MSGVSSFYVILILLIFFQCMLWLAKDSLYTLQTKTSAFSSLCHHSDLKRACTLRRSVQISLILVWEFCIKDILCKVKKSSKSSGKREINISFSKNPLLLVGFNKAHIYYTFFVVYLYLRKLLYIRHTQPKCPHNCRCLPHTYRLSFAKYENNLPQQNPERS